MFHKRLIGSLVSRNKDDQEDIVERIDCLFLSFFIYFFLLPSTQAIPHAVKKLDNGKLQVTYLNAAGAHINVPPFLFLCDFTLPLLLVHLFSSSPFLSFC